MLSLGPVEFCGEQPPVPCPVSDPLPPPTPPSSAPAAPDTPTGAVATSTPSKPPSSKKAARKASKAAKVVEEQKLKMTSDDDDDLPFPGAVGPDGKHEVGYLPPLDFMKQPVLKAWCKEFKLPVGGKKADLIQHLKDFSADRGAWNSLLPGVQNAHKGPRIGAKSTKKSTNRRNALLGTLAVEDGKAVVLHQLPTERSKDLRTVEEVEYGLEWAANVAKTFPYHEPPDKTMPPSMPPVEEDVSAPIPGGLSAEMAAEMIRLQQQLQRTQLQLIDALARPSCGPLTAPPTVALMTPPSSSPFLHALPPPAPVLPSPVPIGGPVQPPLAVTTTTQSRALECMLPDATKKPKNIKELTLGNGVTIRFSPADVPALPALSFVSTLGRLNNIWDDTSEYWNKDNPDTPLTIKGQPIALIYWPAVFTYSKNKKWEVIKKQFVDWREFVTRYRKGTPEEFWAEFSKDGKCLPWTTITERLREERVAGYEVTVKRAHERYGSSFNTVFSYSKKGKMVVMSRPCTIHEHYLKLHPGGV